MGLLSETNQIEQFERQRVEDAFFSYCFVFEARPSHLALLRGYPCLQTFFPRSHLNIRSLTGLISHFICVVLWLSPLFSTQAASVDLHHRRTSAHFWQEVIKTRSGSRPNPVSVTFQALCNSCPGELIRCQGVVIGFAIEHPSSETSEF